MLKFTLVTALMVAGFNLAVPVRQAAAEETSIFDITGKWSGKGFVQKDDKSRKMNVTSEIEGAQSGDQIGFDGECRAMMVLMRCSKFTPITKLSPWVVWPPTSCAHASLQHRNA